jgi:nitroreductase
MLSMGEQYPKAVHDECYACGHCVAVCPKAAIDNEKSPLAKQMTSHEMLPTQESTEFLLKSRRSTRKYQSKPVPRQLIEKLLDIARYAPTGANSQGITYLVIDTPETLLKITEEAVKHMKRTLNRRSPYYNTLRRNIERYRKEGKDPVLFGAPCLIVALFDKTPALAKTIPALFRPFIKRFITKIASINAVSSLLQAQIFAPTLGVGSCVSGVITEFSSGSKELLAVINPPPGKMIAGALMVGYPAVTYQRIVARDSLQIVWS